MLLSALLALAIVLLAMYLLSSDPTKRAHWQSKSFSLGDQEVVLSTDGQLERQVLYLSDGSELATSIGNTLVIGDFEIKLHRSSKGVPRFQISQNGRLVRTGGFECA